MSDPTAATQLAIMTRLFGTIPAIGVRVYDYVPKNPVFPYITVSSPSSVPIDEMCWDRSDMRFQIDVWSSLQQTHEVKEISAAVRAMFHEQEMNITGFALDRMYVDGIFYTREEATALNRGRIVLVVEAQPV